MNLPKKYLLNRKIHKASICKKRFQNYLKKKKTTTTTNVEYFHNVGFSYLPTFILKIQSFIAQAFCQLGPYLHF